MLQIVFSDSECGSLKLATHCCCINSKAGPIGFIFDESEAAPEGQERAMAKLKAQREEEKRRARPVGGNPGDVLCPSCGLDMGPLSGPDVDKARFNLLAAWLGATFLSRTAPPRIIPNSVIRCGSSVSRTGHGCWRPQKTARKYASGTAPPHPGPCVGFTMCAGYCGASIAP